MRAGMLAAGLATLALTSTVCAQSSYPNHPIQVVVGWSPGAAVDIMTRSVAEEMSKSLGQKLVVVNREGAAGTIGFAAVANAAHDGYTLGAGPVHSINVAGHMMNKRKPFDVDSFEYVCQTFVNDFTIAVRKDAPYASILDLVAAMRAQPGKLSYGHLGPGSIPHLAMVEFLQRVDAQAVGVPYRGDAQVLPALIGGSIDIGVSSLLSVLAQADNVRVLAVFGDKRSQALPELPSLSEQGIQMSPNRGMNGIIAPKGTPPDIINLLSKACEAAVRSESVTTLARQIQSGANFLDSPAFARAIREDYRVKGELIRRLNLVMD